MTAASMSFIASPAVAGQSQQVHPGGGHSLTVPPHTSVWAIVAFLGDDLIDVTVTTEGWTKSVQGQRNENRLAEFSWANQQDYAQTLRVIAAHHGSPEQLRGGGCGSGAHEFMMGFGQRPRTLASEQAYEAVFVSFLFPNPR